MWAPPTEEQAPAIQRFSAGRRLKVFVFVFVFAFLLLAGWWVPAIAQHRAALQVAQSADEFNSNGQPSELFGSNWQSTCEQQNASNPYVGMDPLSCHGVMMPEASVGQCLPYPNWRLLKHLGHYCYFCIPIVPPIDGEIVPLDQLRLPKYSRASCAVDQSDACSLVCGPRASLQAPPVHEPPEGNPTAIPQPQSPSTDCIGLLAQARATAAAIAGGNTGPTPMIDLTEVLQTCPPAFARPIDCFGMMVDAQSKVRTNPGYSRRRAQEALLCYEKQDSGRGARQETSRQPPTFHYFYINGIHTPMNAQMITAKGIQPVRLKGVPGGYYTYEYNLVNRNLVHWPGLRIENEVDHMEGYTHNFSQMDPLWTSLGAKFCDADQQYVGAPAQVAMRQSVHDAIAAVLCPFLMQLDAIRNASIADLVECFFEAIKPEYFEPLQPPEVLRTTNDKLVRDVTQQILSIYREERALDVNSRGTNYFIIIGHSQGNFFTEAVGYRLANLSGPAGYYVFKNRLAILSLGSPTSYDSLSGNPDFYQKKIAHITRKDDAIQIVDVASGFGVLGKRPWPRAQDTSALDKRRPQFELDFYFGSVPGALRANDMINAPQLPLGSAPNPLIVPFLNAHLLDNYLTDPTSTLGGTPVLKEVQSALRGLKSALLTGS